MRCWLTATIMGLSTASPVWARPTNEIISYRLIPGGLCPGESFHGCLPYSFTLDGDGNGLFRNLGHGGPMDPVAFHASPAQNAAFRERLKRYRPNGAVVLTARPPCRDVLPDADTIEIHWDTLGKPARSLALSGGCVGASPRFDYRTLRSAVDLLPLGSLTGDH